MPVIETYSSGGTAQYQKASSDDFADARGLETLAKAMGTASADIEAWKIKQKELQDAESRLVMARKMAESDQSWMVEINKRREAVERGEMSASGMTDIFSQEYTKHADEMVSGIKDPKLAEEFRIRLIERQTSYMGSLMDYEARKRADGLKANYDGFMASSLAGIIRADTPENLELSRATAEINAKSLPTTELQKEAIGNINKYTAQRAIMMADGHEQVDGVVDAYLGTSTVDDGVAVSLAGMAMDKKDQIESKAISTAAANITSAADLAEIGMMNPGALADAFDSLYYIRDEAIREDLRGKILSLQSLNIQRKKIINTPPSQFSELIGSMSASAQAESNPDKQKEILGQIGVLQKARDDRDKMLSKDFASYATANSDLVISADEIYQQSLEVGDAQTQQMAFNNRLDAMDTYAAKIGYQGPVNYLPEQQVDKITSELKQAINKKDGPMAVEQMLGSMAMQYGPRFGKVMEQLRNSDIDVIPASVVARISANGTQEQRQKALDIVKAVSYEQQNPEAYKDEKRFEDLNFYAADSEYQSIKTAMELQGMATEVRDRQITFDKLVKYYTIQGTSDPVNDAASVVYGDLVSDGKVLIPASYKSSTDVLLKANASAAIQIKSGAVRYPELSNQMSVDDIKQNPNNAISWVNIEDGSGLRAVWFGSNDNPVVKTDGNLLEYKFRQYDFERVVPSNYVPPGETKTKQEKKDIEAIMLRGRGL